MAASEPTSSESAPAPCTDLDLDGVLIPLQPLYQLCVKYYKENNGKNLLNIGYEDKNKLLAYMKQFSHGKYTPNDGPELGFLDVVGNDRRLAWQALKEMDNVEAMTHFIKLLYRCSPSLKPYVIAYQVQQQEEERKRKLEQEERERQEREAAERSASQNSAQATNTAYEQQIRAALNQQTYPQFSQYAANLHPDDAQQQAITIKQLQDQHFNQYLKQAYEQQIQQQQQQQNPQAQSGMATSTDPPPPVQPQQSELAAKMNAVSLDSEHEAIINNAMANTVIPDGLTNGTTSANRTNAVIQEASMWTQKEINNFKAAIRKESKMENHNDCIIKVGSGETVTIRVPTHESGTCLFWEFATDHYDVAFGVHFEWTDSPDSSVQIQVSESSDEDEEGLEGATSDPERANSAKESTSGPPIDEVVPIYRRDCHEEVYCGSHVYPGKGVYLLKFDNSYSLWRSKTLYYRVYYSR